MRWARLLRPAAETVNVESRFTDEEKRNYQDAMRLLKRKVIATAVMIGESNLEGMERGVAEINLQMALEQAGVPAFVDPADRYCALRSFNWCVQVINRTRTALNKPHLVCQAGFRNRLVGNEYDGWK